MTTWNAPLRDLQYVLHDLLQVSAQGLDRETTDQVLEAAATFAAEVAAPLNAIGDAHGCRMPAPGVVLTPPGYKAAYDQFTADGWTALACRPEHGGQGLPATLENAVFEMLCGANMAWAAYPGMSHAAYVCLDANGNEAQKPFYLPRIASGEWAGTMCLTEPHAGPDLGLLRTRAEPHADGSYRVTGTKIFISGGEQDLTANIVHLVLARLPDAPPGVKGISLFIVPKFLPHEDGSLGERNTLACGSIEHKMGIHGNATCTMNFEGARGWLLGEPNRGLAAMFVMMNHARLIVGVNAIGLMASAYQMALAYAKDRLQGRSPVPAGTGAADPIIQHADVRRMLLTQKAYVEGARAFALWVTHLAELQHTAEDAQARREAAELLALCTPVVKAFSSDLAVECIQLAIQCYGGHGFIVENRVEQYLRDARIIPLYEGANGIQAMDLLARKVLADGGERLDLLLSTFERWPALQGAAGEEFKGPLHNATTLVRALARELQTQARNDPHAAGAAAVPFLRLLGHVALGWMWARMGALAAEHPDDAFHQAKLHTARYFHQRLLPEIHGLAAVIRAGATPVMALPVDAF